MGMFNFRKLAAIGGVCLSVLVAGCGGGDSSSGTTPTTTVSGVAMAGPFLSGNVCAYQITNGGQGSQLACSLINAATSDYSINFSGYTGDVLVAMEGAATYDDEATSGDETTGTPLVGTLRSIVNISADGMTANVALTPLTEAAIRTANTLNRAAIEAAGQQLAQTFGLTTTGFDMFATLPRLAPTSGDHIAYRQALRALSQMQNGAGIQYQGKLGDYLAYFAANVGTMQAAVQTAIQTNLSSNCSFANNAITCTVASTGGGSGSGTGDYTLTISGTASGFAIPTITINNVPKPANQTDFCGDVSVQSALNNAATGGTLTINSCTFNGTSGSISATLNIATPVSMTVPYTVNYSYAANTEGAIAAEL